MDRQRVFTSSLCVRCWVLSDSTTEKKLREPLNSRRFRWFFETARRRAVTLVGLRLKEVDYSRTLKSLVESRFRRTSIVNLSMHSGSEELLTFALRRKSSLAELRRVIAGKVRCQRYTGCHFHALIRTGLHRRSNPRACRHSDCDATAPFCALIKNDHDKYIVFHLTPLPSSARPGPRSLWPWQASRGRYLPRRSSDGALLNLPQRLHTIVVDQIMLCTL